MAYTSQSNIESYLDRSLTTAEVTHLTTLLPSVDTIIEEIIGTSYADNEVALYFDGGTSIVDLPGMTTISSVNYYDQDTDTLDPIDTTSYTEYPLNSVRKFYIRMRTGKFTSGEGNVAVIGNTGAAPSEIVEAATIMAADFLSSTGSAGVVTEEKIGDWTKKYAGGMDSSSGTRTKVLQLLAPYRDIMF